MSHGLPDAEFRKSTRSQQGGECVEVAPLPGVVAVGDSKHPQHPALQFPTDAFAAFVAAAKRNELDL